jgi:hypothetical protein
MKQQQQQMLFLQQQRLLLWRSIPTTVCSIFIAESTAFAGITSTRIAASPACIAADVAWRSLHCQTAEIAAIATTKAPAAAAAVMLVSSKDEEPTSLKMVGMRSPNGLVKR